MADTTPATAPALPPELLQTIAEAVGAALAKQPADAAEGTPSTPPVPSGEIGHSQVQDMINPLPAPTWIRPTHRLVSRKFWVTVSTVATLIAQKPAGLDLSPAALVAVAAVAAIYVAAQAIVDSAKAGDRHE